MVMFCSQSLDGWQEREPQTLELNTIIVWFQDKPGILHQKCTTLGGPLEAYYDGMEARLRRRIFNIYNVQIFGFFLELFKIKIQYDVVPPKGQTQTGQIQGGAVALSQFSVPQWRSHASSSISLHPQIPVSPVVSEAGALGWSGTLLGPNGSRRRMGNPLAVPSWPKGGETLGLLLPWTSWGQQDFMGPWGLHRSQLRAAWVPAPSPVHPLLAQGLQLWGAAVQIAGESDGSEQSPPSHCLLPNCGRHLGSGWREWSGSRSAWEQRTAYWHWHCCVLKTLAEVGQELSWVSSISGQLGTVAAVGWSPLLVPKGKKQPLGEGERGTGRKGKWLWEE